MINWLKSKLLVDLSTTPESLPARSLRDLTKWNRTEKLGKSDMHKNHVKVLPFSLFKNLNSRDNSIGQASRGILFWGLKRHISYFGISWFGWHSTNLIMHFVVDRVHSFGLRSLFKLLSWCCKAELIKLKSGCKEQTGIVLCNLVMLTSLLELWFCKSKRTRLSQI